MESKQEKNLEALFSFLKGLNLKGFDAFPTYEDWKKAKSPKSELHADRHTQLDGQVGYSVQQAATERKEFMDNLSDKEKAEFKFMFNKD